MRGEDSEPSRWRRESRVVSSWRLTCGLMVNAIVTVLQPHLCERPAGCSVPPVDANCEYLANRSYGERRKDTQAASTTSTTQEHGQPTLVLCLPCHSAWSRPAVFALSQIFVRLPQCSFVCTPSDRLVHQPPAILP
ncbi:hypothetical protein MTO96_009712 [Rhipicephalus appendiculatus]